MNSLSGLLAAAPPYIHDIHRSFAWFVVVGNGLVGAWALAADRWKVLRRRELWWAVWVTQASVFVQVILGVVRTRARQRAGIDDVRWIDGEEIGAHVAGVIAGTSPLADATVHYFIDKQAGPQAAPEGLR